MLAQVKLDAAPCSICASTENTVLYPAGVAQAHQVVRCNTCELMFASPRLATVTNADQWQSAQQAEEIVKPIRLDKEQLQIRDHRTTRAYLKQHYPARGKLVEVGSSCGFLLKALRDEDGWDVCGIEPDKRLADYAVQVNGVPTINALCEDAGVPDGSVDVIIMLHVIEHVPDPVGLLKELNRMLKPGGLVVLETPTYDTLPFKLLGRRERSLSCDGHILFYTAETLRKTYELAGFTLEQLKFVGRSLTLERLAWNVAVMSKSATVKRWMASLSEKLGLSKLAVTINVHDMQRHWIRKPLST
jgi:2-polyprenyl-3-methyl-5-hydroxy-6-metoxy-1,4-benzoquinol methylase